MPRKAEIHKPRQLSSISLQSWLRLGSTCMEVTGFVARSPLFRLRIACAIIRGKGIRRPNAKTRLSGLHRNCQNTSLPDGLLAALISASYEKQRERLLRKPARNRGFLLTGGAFCPFANSRSALA